MIDIITVLNDWAKAALGSALFLIVCWIIVWFVSFSKATTRHNEILSSLQRIEKKLSDSVMEADKKVQ